MHNLGCIGQKIEATLFRTIHTNILRSRCNSKLLKSISTTVSPKTLARHSSSRNSAFHSKLPHEGTIFESCGDSTTRFMRRLIHMNEAKTRGGVPVIMKKIKLSVGWGDLPENLLSGLHALKIESPTDIQACLILHSERMMRWKTTPLQILSRIFPLNAKPIQVLALPHLLNGKDAVLLAETGYLL